MEEKNQDNSTSEWNEQKLFSIIFFRLTSLCRMYQADLDIISWAHTLSSKISSVIGIADVIEREELSQCRKILWGYLSKYSRTPKLFEGTRKRAVGSLAEACFQVETRVDIIANKHLPFLKLKKHVDIQGL